MSKRTDSGNGPLWTVVRWIAKRLVPGSVRARTLSQYAAALLNDFIAQGDAAGVDEMIATLQREVTFGSPDDPNRRVNLSNLGFGLMWRDRQSEGSSDLDDAVTALRQAAEISPAGDPHGTMIQANLRDALLRRSARDDSASDLAEGIAAARAALSAGGRDGPGHLNQRSLQAALANALRIRFERTSGIGDLDEAIDLWRAALEEIPNGHPNRAGWQSNLLRAQRIRSEWTGDQAGPYSVIARAQAVVDLASGVSPDRPTLLPNLGVAHLPVAPDQSSDEASTVQGDPGAEGRRAALDALVAAADATALRDAYRLASVLGPDGVLVDLRSRMWWASAERDYRSLIVYRQRAEFVSRAIRAGAAVAAAELERRTELAYRLAAFVFYATPTSKVERLILAAYPDLPRLEPGQGGDANARDAIAAKVARMERAARSEERDTSQEGIWYEAAAMADAMERRGENADPAGVLRATAFVLCTVAVLTMPPDADRTLVRALLTCASTIASYIYGRSTDGEIGALDWLVSFDEQLVTEPSPDTPRSWALVPLSVDLRYRYGELGNDVDLDRLIEVLTELVDRYPPADGAVRADYLAKLVDRLVTRFRRTGQYPDLDAAIDRYLQLLSLPPPNRPDTDAAALTDLADLYVTRFTRTRRTRDANEAVDLYRRAVAQIPDDHPDRVGAQASLANILRLRYDQTRLDSDIDAAIEIGRAAAAATPPDDPAYPDRRSGVALALRARFIRAGRSEDIDDAVDLLTSIVEETGGHPDRARYMSNLAESLVVRLGVGATDDLIAEVGGVLEDQAGSAATQRERNQARLATDRWLRPGLDRDVDAAEAADLYQQAIGATNTSDPEYAVYLSNLAVVRRYQASRTGQPIESPATLDAMLDSVRTSEPDDPRRAGLLFNLGSLLLEDEGPNDAAIGYLRQAATMPTAPAHVRLRAAWTWAQAATGAGDLTSATDAYAIALDQLLAVTWHGRDRTHQEEQVSSRLGLPSDAAAVAIGADRSDRAVELLEQGRSVLWTRILNLRGDLTRLAERAPALSMELDRVRAALDRP